LAGIAQKAPGWGGIWLAASEEQSHSSRHEYGNSTHGICSQQLVNAGETVTDEICYQSVDHQDFRVTYSKSVQ